MFKKLINQFEKQSVQHHELSKGTYLFHQDDPVRSAFIVEDGLIELTRFQPDGTALVLQRATGGVMLAEASIYSDHYHCDAITSITSQVFEVPIAHFLELLEGKEISRMWVSHLARETQSARYRAELMSRKTVSERLDGWLDWPGNNMPEKGEWKDLATQIGVSPEALYREIAKRRRKGFAVKASSL